MHFQGKMTENGGENIFIDNETTNKVNVTFSAVVNKEIARASFI